MCPEVPLSVCMALLRAGAFRRLGKTVNDFFISRHLLPDGKLRIRYNPSLKLAIDIARVVEAPIEEIFVFK